MPFDPASVAADAGTRVVNLKIVQSVGRNPIFLALVIVLIVMIIVGITFRESDGVGTLTMRAGFWSFLAITCALFVNNSIMMQENTEVVKSGAYSEIFDYREPPTAMRRPVSVAPDNVVHDEIPTINMAGL